ncbi:MAG: indole-3-glycerol phosphate synthase TrpC [Hellea sp.]|nr:indole-3-glycerol phosphate synthase TrpC [Hellea sp.]
MPNILAKIAAYKAYEVKTLKETISADALKAKALATPIPRGFKAALDRVSKAGPALIAEVKKASPSKGIIRDDFDPVAIAKAYTEGGAACLSVLTDNPSFQGSLEIFRQVRAATDLPLLRKDFMLDPIQVYEAREAGADAILIILAMTDDTANIRLIAAAKEMELDVLVETHDAEELARAVALGADLIGINNRDLRTFETTLDTFTNIAPLAPTGATLVAESGIFTPDQILRLAGDGAQAYLVGESLMRQDDVKLATKALLGIAP